MKAVPKVTGKVDSREVAVHKAGPIERGEEASGEKMMKSLM